MSLLKSLFCIKGYDNGRRYLVISLIAYLAFFATSSILAKAPIILVLLLLIFSPILLAASMRRVHDAGFATLLAGAPVAIYWLCVIGVTYVSHSAAWALLILAVLVTLALATLRKPGHRRQAGYEFGYSGPVNIGHSESEPALSAFERIEPTIAHPQSLDAEASIRGFDTEKQSDDKDNIATPHLSTQAQASGSWQVSVTDWLQQNQKVAAIITLIIVILVVGSVSLFSFTEGEKHEEIDATEKTIAQPKQRLHKVELPDNFWIMLDEFNALTIAWQGDLKPDGKIWSAINGEGDKTCIDATFDGGIKFRVMQTTVKNQGDYYADFSPVDTTAIVEAIAKRSRFKLCGYDFSLKGTQAKLMVKRAYSEMLMPEF